MGWIWTILIGFLVGVLAKFLHPGKDDLGFIMTTLLGIVCSVLAGALGRSLGWYRPGQGAGFLASVVVAFLLLWIYGKVRSKA